MLSATAAPQHTHTPFVANSTRAATKESTVISNVLTIAGTDPTGGAGIQADLKAFSALGAYGMSVVTAVVAQNTRGVREFVALEPSFVADQIAAVFDDVRVDAVKIGMVANAGIIEAIADSLDRYATCPVVLDPVMVAKSGDHLLAPEAVDAIRERLVTRSTIITPNLPEAQVLLGRDTEIADLAGMRASLDDLMTLGSPWVLLKGGHLADGDSVDLLAGPATAAPTSGASRDRAGRSAAFSVAEFTSPRVRTVNTHGTGCTLSAAIAALLPGSEPVAAVSRAKEYLTGALRHADDLDVGGGQGPVHHFHELWNHPTTTEGDPR